ncbi:MAG: head fiber protein [Clostridia bacterium]|nr:head fiber protein [Clostridia bacterium]
MSTNCKNYTAHGGNTTVIGGKLTFLPGAEVEGLADILDLSQESSSYELPAATSETLGGVKAAANQAESAATTIAVLKDNFNALLSKLKAAGIMLPDAVSDE